MSLAINKDEIETRAAQFRSDLATTSDDMLMVRRFILHGSSFALRDNEVFSLADEISTHWQVHPNRDVYLVGSAKLGFSISPSKRWRPFGDESDIDVAVVSDKLFEAYWNEIDSYVARPESWADRERCRSTVASGWIRPDYLPAVLADEWFEFFRSVQMNSQYAGGIKIAAGLYYSMSFLERYQATAIKKCRSEAA